LNDLSSKHAANTGEKLKAEEKLTAFKSIKTSKPLIKLLYSHFFNGVAFLMHFKILKKSQ
tara:strand:- start:411 stop:590 length:180 start_codon:yes stop_codon:yes gene_type:complete